MKTEPNEPINGCTESRRYGSEDQFVTEDFYPGLTKREHFASMAMQGLISDQAYLRPNQGEEIAQRAVEIADSLINELNKNSHGDTKQE